MAPVLPIVGGLALLVLAASAGQGSGGPAEQPSPGGLDDLRVIMTAAELPSDWQTFLAAVAWGESGFHSDAALGPNDHPGRPPWCRKSRASASLQRTEANAARAMYRSNLQRFAGSNYPASHYEFGSGGWFGFLPAVGIINGFAATPEWIPAIDPWDVCDPVLSVVMAVGYARGLSRWDDFRDGGGTWLTLRVGWGRPGSMDDPSRLASRRASFGQALEAVGASPSFMDRRVSALGDLFPRGIDLFYRIEARLEQHQGAAAA